MRVLLTLYVFCWIRCIRSLPCSCMYRAACMQLLIFKVLQNTSMSYLCVMIFYKFVQKIVLCFKVALLSIVSILFFIWWSRHIQSFDSQGCWSPVARSRDLGMTCGPFGNTPHDRTVAIWLVFLDLCSIFPID